MIEFLRSDWLFLRSHPIGSRYTCTPPIMDTDKDTVILVTDIAKAEARLLSEGWDPCLKGEYFDTYFKAFRKGVDNYVIVSNEDAFQRYIIAAEVCKALNVQSKEDRCKAYQACLEASQGFIGIYDWKET